LTRQYPERLGRVFFVEPTTLVWVALRLAKIFGLDEVTASKISSVSGEQVREQFLSTVPPRLLTKELGGELPLPVYEIDPFDAKNYPQGSRSWLGFMTGSWLNFWTSSSATAEENTAKIDEEVKRELEQMAKEEPAPVVTTRRRRRRRKEAE